VVAGAVGVVSETVVGVVDGAVDGAVVGVFGRRPPATIRPIAATRTMRPLVMKNFFKAWPWVIRGDARLQGRRAGCAAVRAPSPKSREG
jgi:hypothetical protein